MAIVTRLKVHKLKEEITALDPEAFFYVQRIKEVGVGIVKRKKVINHDISNANNTFSDHYPL